MIVRTEDDQDVEVYEGPPDEVFRNLEGKQDDSEAPGFSTFAGLAVRTTRQALDWYKDHRVFPSSLSFDPDGMCLKVVRTARGIGPKYASAFQAQVATPNKYRVRDVSKIRVGMPIYFDDPHDGNDFGHVAMVGGRVAGSPRSALASLLIPTNSVKANQIVTVRGDYFQKHWGDEFQFAATWLNGVVIPDLQEKPVPPKPTKTLVQQMRTHVNQARSIGWDAARASKGTRRVAINAGQRALALALKVLPKK